MPKTSDSGYPYGHPDKNTICSLINLELLAIADAVKLDELTLREYAKTFERDGLPENAGSCAI